MNNTKTITGTIKFKVLPTHPDIKYVSNPNEQLSFSDTYEFSSDYWDLNNIDAMLQHVKYDLKLIAGGGYSTEGITDVSFAFD